MPPAHVAEEDATVVGVERAPLAAVGLGRAEGAGGDEVGQVKILVDAVADEAEDGGRAVKLTEAVAEAAARDEVMRRHRGLQTRAARTRFSGSAGGRRMRISLTISSIKAGIGAGSAEDMLIWLDSSTSSGERRRRVKGCLIL
jgi:hypothetical protein